MLGPVAATVVVPAALAAVPMAATKNALRNPVNSFDMRAFLSVCGEFGLSSFQHDGRAKTSSVRTIFRRLFQATTGCRT
jgi:hypothetical protein